MASPDLIALSCASAPCLEFCGTLRRLRCMAELGLAASARSSDANVKARETRPGGNIVQERAILSSTFNYDKIRKIGYHLILSLCKGLELFPQRDSGYTILSYLSNTLARAADHSPPPSPVASRAFAATPTAATAATASPT